MTDGRRSLNNTSSGNGLNTHQMSDAGQHAQPYHNEVINRDVQTQQSHTGDKNNEGSGIDRTPNRYNNTDPVKDHERQPYQNRDWNDSRTIPDRNTPVQENNHSNPRQEQQPDNWRNNPRQEREDPVRMREDRPDNNRAVPRNEPNSLPDRRQEGGRRENRMPSVRSESPRMESPRMSSGGGGGGSVRGKRR